MSVFSIDKKKIVFEGDNFILYDVSDMLIRHKNFPHGTDVVKPNGKRAVPSSWCFREKGGRKIDTMYCHQTAGSVSCDGFDALLNTWEFMIRDPSYDENGNWTGRGRGWPGGAYTYYIPFNPVMYQGKVVIFKCWDHSWVTWHSSDNDSSEAVVCQGYFKHSSMKSFVPKKGCPKGQPSQLQELALRGFLSEYVVQEMGISPGGIKGHCDSPVPKLACPGDYIEGICSEVGGLSTISDFDVPSLPHVNGLLSLVTWEERQSALVLLGHWLGDSGEKKNGVDGDAGNLTRCAIETEEANLGLRVDGYWDDTFDYHVKVQLLVRGMSQEDVDALI